MTGWAKRDYVATGDLNDEIETISEAMPAHFADQMCLSFWDGKVVKLTQRLEWLLLLVQADHGAMKLGNGLVYCPTGIIADCEDILLENQHTPVWLDRVTVEFWTRQAADAFDQPSHGWKLLAI